LALNIYESNAGVATPAGRPDKIALSQKAALDLRSRECRLPNDLRDNLKGGIGLARQACEQGQSLVPLLQDGGRWRRRPAISERKKSEATRDPLTANSTAIVWNGWKLIRNAERPEDRPEYELFDHEKDPLDLANVAEQHPDKVAELSKLLDSWHLWVKERRLPTDTELTQGVSGEELERLRSLGYVQ